MKRMLLAVNAKYIHSNLAVYSLKAYAEKYGYSVCMREFTINQREDEILRELYREAPDVLAVSVYIWNVTLVRELLWDISRILPGTELWLGGPEVSFCSGDILEELPFLSGIMRGEGEETFACLCRFWEERESKGDFRGLEAVPGITWRDGEGMVRSNPDREPLDLDELPFPYQGTEDLRNRIIYYESSRGCPFNCSYCLSSVDKKLRFRSLPLVYKELQFFIDAKVPQVKFVDRTFNCQHEHAMGIWKYIKEHDNGITNFHFEISADLLREDELELISDMRPGLIQLEIGVQSTNGDTIREIHRTMRLEEVYRAVNRVKAGKNIHQHLDLIAGLPFEDYQRFQQSFNDIYALHPQQLQLGFLKVLKGSYMYEHAQEYGLVYRSRPPYEVMASKWVSYDEMLEIRLVEEMLELHYNSGQFLTYLAVLEWKYDSTFQMFLDMGHFYREHGYLDCSHSRVRRTEIVQEFAEIVDPERRDIYREALIFDLYKIEKSKSRPFWAKNVQQDKRQTGKYLREHGMEKKYCHFEYFEHINEKGEITEEKDPLWLLFDYENRDSLTNEAALFRIDEMGLQSGCGGVQ